MRTHMPNSKALEILGEEYLRAGYPGVADGLKGHAASFPSTLAIIEAMGRAYDLGITSMLRVTEKN